MEQLNRKEIIELVNAIINPKEELSEAMLDELIFKLKRNVIYPNPSDLIFYTELSAEEIADKILDYKSILL
ncbi:bacteriocin immunity protein [Clostridium perfringens]|uniref:bacteriocin immunity protein n=1 Tax=Clostridium perfringens TaxID=1502 RepID=UPI000E17531A|nr:bacteriocin immunity protein [Clostridium perfringens]MDH5087036.1 Colicin immunity protein / pyocin immunity protein [Clostridium perfringens]SUY29644.1 Colicin immunity protein / pyocin immunity protein [Clostridium perfringens]HAT4138788.1 hypothetical protein [Clostridium perfringens]